TYSSAPLIVHQPRTFLPITSGAPGGIEPRRRAISWTRTRKEEKGTHIPREEGTKHLTWVMVVGRGSNLDLSSASIDWSELKGVLNHRDVFRNRM
ncbi:MAG: hypothetical protein ACREO5_02245, partial [Candidatus Binatia bacterium]